MTLLIRNVKILGGEKEYSEPCDVFVTGNTISAIGNFPNKKADTVLDGQGAYLSPGFIDVNTDSDHYLTLFDDRGQEDFLRQGVTTIFGGMCGASLAPLPYGTLESIRKWGDPDRVNVNWHTMADFLEVLDKRPLAVNFGTLVGHSTVRRALVGEALRDLTKNELGVFARTLREALDQGAFGFSTGLSYVHARGAPYAEISALAAVVAERGDIYATHLRHTAGPLLAESVDETLRIAGEHGVRTLISHFMPLNGSGHEYERALARLNDLPASVRVRFDAYPYPYSLLPMYTFLPLWAQNGGIEVMLNNIKDEWLLARIRKDMPEFREDDFMIAQVPGNDFLVGKNLREVKEMYGIPDAREALLKLMATAKMKGSVIYRNLDEGLIMKALMSPRSLIASNAPSLGGAARRKSLKSDRTTSTFTKFLALAASGALMPLEDAIKKITAEPAEMFGLKGRGVLKEGNFADLACFKAGEGLAEVRFTVVNGTVAQSGGDFQGAFPGKVLRRKP